MGMQPQAIFVGARQSLAIPPGSANGARGSQEAPAYRLTRRVMSGHTFELFRAAAKGELGPGCCVLKTPRPDLIGRDVATAMLRREADVVAGVRHPNLNCVLASDTESPAPYLLLPYHDGVSIRQLLESLQTFVSVSKALNIVRQVAEALAELHRGGWLHGQVRPEHVVLSPQGRATLIDLTSARRLETAECDCASAVVNAKYAAPEMTSINRRLGIAADIYSLGIMLYEVLAGRAPFEASSRQEVQQQHRHEAVPDIRAVRPDVSLEVAHLVRLMLAKEPLRRPSDSELVRWVAELEIATL
jgi:serine/threonine-protein kinase